MLDRFDFDTVLFPINFVQYANPEYRRNTGELLRQCREREVGMQVWFMLGGLIALIIGLRIIMRCATDQEKRFVFNGDIRKW